MAKVSILLSLTILHLNIYEELKEKDWEKIMVLS